MARKLRQLIRLAAVAVFPILPAVAQESSPAPQAAPSGSKPPLAPQSRQEPGAKPPDQFEDARRIFEKFSPEERQHFRENLQRWRNMPDQEKTAMRDREQARREKIAQEMDESMQKSGLHLDPDRREVYALRYAQERRKIEDKLRKEMEEKRRPLMQEMLNRLKTEFSSAAAPTVTPIDSPGSR